mmetsp:Transcript_86626/g.245124  ORF Transcript_86626/g.245124 Transcript_86626/m.245124 type:complete len:243 (+) Transcript_86626:746-1474(+)
MVHRGAVDAIGCIGRHGLGVAVAGVKVVRLDLGRGVGVVRLVEPVDTVSVERDADQRRVIGDSVIVVAREVVVVVVRSGVATARIEHERVHDLTGVTLGVACDLERGLAGRHVNTRVTGTGAVAARRRIAAEAEARLLRSVDVDAVHREANAAAERGAVRALRVRRRREVLGDAVRAVVRVRQKPRRIAQWTVAPVVVRAQVGRHGTVKFAIRFIIGARPRVVVRRAVRSAGVTIGGAGARG